MGLYTIGLLSVSEIFGDFALKKFANDGGAKHLAYGILGYVGGDFLPHCVAEGIQCDDGECRMGWDFGADRVDCSVCRYGGEIQ